VYNRSVQRASFFTKQKRKVMKMQVDDPGGPGSPAARKKNKKTVPSPEEKEEKKDRKGRSYVEGGEIDGCTTRWW
jgi:hypothetical protein